MPTNITQVEDPERDKLVLRVKGELAFDDAILLERIALDLKGQSDKAVAIDLADLGFMDSDAAPILKRIEEKHGFEIEGLQFFLQKVVNETENRT